MTEDQTVCGSSRKKPSTLTGRLETKTWESGQEKRESMARRPEEDCKGVCL